MCKAEVPPKNKCQIEYSSLQTSTVHTLHHQKFKLSISVAMKNGSRVLFLVKAVKAMLPNRNQKPNSSDEKLFTIWVPGVTPVGRFLPWRTPPSSTCASLGIRCSVEAKTRLFAAIQDPVPDLLWSYLSRQEASRALLKIRENWKLAL